MTNLLPECEGRLLIDSEADGAWNMAVDEILLENANRGQLTLRFYTWQQATVSLGYFQRHAERLGHAASRNCPIVRRASGGGAILHDQGKFDLTYSVALPSARQHRDVQDSLYRVMHQSLVEALAELGVDARRCESDRFDGRSRDKPFLCFQRLTAGDVLIDDQKVMGSAQRRSADALLQHGSLLLGRSPHAPELPGVLDLTGRSVSAGDVRSAWRDRLAVHWNVNWLHDALDTSEHQRVGERVREKFGHEHWTQRR